MCIFLIYFAVEKKQIGGCQVCTYDNQEIDSTRTKHYVFYINYPEISIAG